MGCGFVTGEQQQHRHHLVAADVSPFLFDADKLGDQSFAAGLTRGLQTLLHIAFHGEDLRNEVRKPKALVKRVKPLAQAVNFGRSARGSPRSSQITDSGSFRAWRSTRSGGSFQPLGQFASDRQNARLHFKHGLPAKRLVDDTPQAGVIRLVGRQHVVGDRAHDFWHPPPKSHDVAVVLSQSECPAVSQDLIGEALRRGRPNRPDEREPNLDDWARGPRLLDLGGWVTEVLLTGEIRVE
jgi:hypothetical protein